MRGHRRSRLESARGSANEARAVVTLACACGYVGEQQAAEINTLYDRVLALTYWFSARASAGARGVGAAHATRPARAPG